MVLAAYCSVLIDGREVLINKKGESLFAFTFRTVGIPGLEPGITGPESVVLPITPYPNFRLRLIYGCLLLKQIKRVKLYLFSPSVWLGYQGSNLE